MDLHSNYIYIAAFIVAAILVLKFLGAPKGTRKLGIDQMDQQLAKSRLASLEPSLRSELEQLLSKNQKINAIKELRETHKELGLKEAKDIVDILEIEMKAGGSQLS
jgi:ribosomal protein L7/L12